MHEVARGPFAKGKLHSEFESKHDPDEALVARMDRLAEQHLNEPKFDAEKAKEESLQADANKEVPTKWNKLSAATVDILSDDNATVVQKAKHVVQDTISNGNNRINNYIFIT